MDKLSLIDISKVPAAVATYIERTERQLFVVKQVIANLSLNEDGKKVDRHLVNRLKKRFTEDNFFATLDIKLSNIHSWTELVITVPDGSFDQIRLQTHYDNEPGVINIPRITELNQRYLLDETRLVNYKKVEKEQVAAAERYNAALRELHAAQEAIDLLGFTYKGKHNSTIWIEDENGRRIK